MTPVEVVLEVPRGPVDEVDYEKLRVRKLDHLVSGVLGEFKLNILT